MSDDSPLYGDSYDAQIYRAGRDHNTPSEPSENVYDAPIVPYVPYRTRPLSVGPGQGDNAGTGQRAEESGIPRQIIPPSEEYQSATEKLRPGRTRRRRWLWPGLLIGLALLLIIAGGFVTYAYVNRPTPQKTLAAFCAALRKENYREAYKQFTPALQGQFSEQDFALAIARDKVVGCSYGVVAEGSSPTTTNLKLVHKSTGVNNDLVFLTKDRENSWKINDLQKVT